MNLHQDIILDRDNNTILRTKAAVGGYQQENNQGFSDVGKLISPPWGVSRMIRMDSSYQC